jgi:hypothetical protein
MFKRVVGIVLICSTSLVGCVTTSQTCTSGPIMACGPEHTSSWPQSSSQPESDNTGAIVGVAALVTAVALTAVLIGRSHNDDDDEKPAKHTAMTDEELRLERMYAQAHLHARAGRCDAVAAIGRKLANEQPVEYERFAADRELAVCLPNPALAVSIR